MKRFFLAVAATLTVSSLAAAQMPGDWVLAQWNGGEYWFPGIIESVSGDAVTIAYDDGDFETLPLALVRPYDWQAGSYIECRWADGTEWYAGHITALSEDGYTLDIAYDDGDRETTSTRACRSH